MAGYAEQKWNQRVGTLGDIAEGIFEQISPFGAWVRHGLNRPPFQMKQLTPEQRNAPDYLCGTGHYVEVQGCGRDNVIKVKLEKWEAQKKWHKHIGEVRFFFWNSNTSEYALISMDALQRLVTASKRKVGVQAFTDGNEYVEVAWDDIDMVTPYVAA